MYILLVLQLSVISGHTVQCYDTQTVKRSHEPTFRMMMDTEVVEHKGGYRDGHADMQSLLYVILFVTKQENYARISDRPTPAISSNRFTSCRTIHRDAGRQGLQGFKGRTAFVSLIYPVGPFIFTGLLRNLIGVFFMGFTFLTLFQSFHSSFPFVCLRFYPVLSLRQSVR